MNGRKRHVLVDTLGLLLAVVVHAADIQESDGAKLVLRRVLGRFLRRRLIRTDQGDKDHFVARAKEAAGWTVEVVGRPKNQKGFAVLPRRWVVERTFTRLGRSCHLSKDDEGLPATHEASVQIEMIHLLLKRLALTWPLLGPALRSTTSITGWVFSLRGECHRTLHQVRECTLRHHACDPVVRRSVGGKCLLSPCE